MKTLILKNSDIETAIKYVYDSLIQYKYSFTVYNITQILRSNGLYVEHKKVHEWFDANAVIELPYRRMHVTICDEGGTAILYTPINVDFDSNVRVYSSLANFTDLVEEYAEWFRCLHDFHMPVDEPADAAEDEDTSEESADIDTDSIAVGGLVRGPDGRFVRRR